MHIYYINLRNRSDRREAMEFRLRDLGLAAERVEALTPADLAPVDLQRYCDSKNHHYLAPAELSCSLSHVAAMQRFLQTNEKFALILEDDALLSPRLPEFLVAFERKNPDVDLLRLETDCNPMRLSIDTEFTVGTVIAHRYYSWCAGTAGYVISRSGAASIIASEQVRFKQTDRAMFNPYEPLSRQLKIRQAVPALVIQEHLASTDRPSASSDLISVRDARDVVDNELNLGRFWYRVLDFLDRDVRIATLKLWHQTVGRAAKRIVPMAE